MNSSKESKADGQKTDIDLKNTFYDLIVEIYTATAYHNRRSLFYQRWYFILLLVDWIGGAIIAFLGFALTVGNTKIISTTDWVQKFLEWEGVPLLIAVIAVFLLFTNILFDFSRKSEKHRWLTASYINLKKEISMIRFVCWKVIYSATDEKKKKYKKKYWKTQTKIRQLIKEEYPVLKFLRLISYYEALQELSSQTTLNGTAEDNAKESNDTIENYFNKGAIKHAIRAIDKISCFRHAFINIFSMPLGAMKFEQKMRDANYKVWWVKLFSRKSEQEEKA